MSAAWHGSLALTQALYVFFLGVLHNTQAPNASILTIPNIESVVTLVSPGHWAVYTRL